MKRADRLGDERPVLRFARPYDKGRGVPKRPALRVSRLHLPRPAATWETSHSCATRLLRQAATMPRRWPGLAVAGGTPRDGARLLGASRLEQCGALTDARLRMRNHVLALVEQALGVDDCAFEMSVGSEFSLNDAIRLARSVLQSTQGLGTSST